MRIVSITLIISLLACSFAGFAQKQYYLLVGTYTRKTSEGIYVYRFDTTTGKLTYVSKATGVNNPSFLAVANNEKNVYSVGEVNGGAVLSYQFDKKTGMLTTLNSQSSGGDNPCHLSLDKSNRWCFVGNYSSGTLSVLPILPDGTLGKASQTIAHEGSGPNTTRQDKPHVHSVNISPDNRNLFVPDLGIDKVVNYRFDAQTGMLNSAPSATVTPGSGPRHFTFHPNGKFAYVIQELNASITGFSYKDGRLKVLQTVGTLPEGYTDKNACADIHVSSDGRFLYGSNRFHDSLVIYAIDPKTGKLTLVGHQSVLGKTPRNFSLDPTDNFVLVANQDSDNVVVFRRNTQTGALEATGTEIDISMPVCLKWIAVD